MANWQYFPEEYLYRKNGRTFSEASILRNIDIYEEERISYVHNLALRLRDGDIDLQRWTRDMRESIKRTHIVEYIIARGGVRRMDPQDWGRLGFVLRNQYRYLDRFANEIATGTLTVGQVQARAALYINAARQSYERGKSQGARGISLPAYPGDGSTECFTNCRCRWEIIDKGDRFECTWKLSAAEHCNTCVVRSGTWNPLVISK